ncbi:MAG TPA: MBL fold metallo-hydrolase [Dongiaceae bacterium]|nr:MBL fold metallo-hydrolase [Dongiaceae bacterium]
MIRNLTITAIVENTAGTLDAAGEWGLALWIEADDRRILCDTGQGHTLLDNARLLGIDLATAEALVISHGHSDHTGAIAALMDAGFHGKIYVSSRGVQGKVPARENTATPIERDTPFLIPGPTLEACKHRRNAAT